MIGTLAPFVCYICYLLLVLLPCQKTSKKPFAKYSQGFPAPYHCSTPSAPRWDQHSYLSKVLRYTPYTCGSSRLFSGTVAGEHSFFCKFTWIYYCLLLSF